MTRLKIIEKGVYFYFPEDDFNRLLMGSTVKENINARYYVHIEMYKKGRKYYHDVLNHNDELIHRIITDNSDLIVLPLRELLTNQIQKGK